MWQNKVMRIIGTMCDVFAELTDKKPFALNFCLMQAVAAEMIVPCDIVGSLFMRHFINAIRRENSQS